MSCVYNFSSRAADGRLLQPNGDRLVGGMRVSNYDAMLLADVQVLLDFMRDFESRHG